MYVALTTAAIFEAIREKTEKIGNLITSDWFLSSETVMVRSARWPPQKRYMSSYWTLSRAEQQWETSFLENQNETKTENKNQKQNPVKSEIQNRSYGSISKRSCLRYNFNVHTTLCAKVYIENNVIDGSNEEKNQQISLAANVCERERQFTQAPSTDAWPWLLLFFMVCCFFSSSLSLSLS